MAVNPTLPTVNGSNNQWGTVNNAAITALDNGKSDVGHNHTASYTLLVGGTVVCVDYTTTPPARPTARTDIVIRWRGQVMPTAMITGDEYVATA